MWTTLNFRGKGKTKKKTARDICERTVDIDFERDWWVSLGPALGNGKNWKYIFPVSGIFPGKADIIGIRIYYKPTTFNQNRWCHFWEKQNF